MKRVLPRGSASSLPPSRRRRRRYNSLNSTWIFPEESGACSRVRISCLSSRMRTAWCISNLRRTCAYLVRTCTCQEIPTKNRFTLLLRAAAEKASLLIVWLSTVCLRNISPRARIVTLRYAGDVIEVFVVGKKKKISRRDRILKYSVSNEGLRSLWEF